MNLNDILTNYLVSCDKLEKYKENKIDEFYDWILTDLEKILAKSSVSREEVEDYLVQFKKNLVEKEKIIDFQISREKNQAKAEALNQIEYYFNQAQRPSKIFNLTDVVMDKTINHIEDVLNRGDMQAEFQDGIVYRLNKAMPANTYNRIINVNDKHSSLNTIDLNQDIGDLSKKREELEKQKRSLEKQASSPLQNSVEATYNKAIT